MPDQHSAASSGRQTGDVLVLRQIATDFVSCRERGDVGVADREASDLGSGCNVSLDERWGGSQDVGNIVESFARIISRKNRRHIDIHTKQVANRVRVLGAIQAV